MKIDSSSIQLNAQTTSTEHNERRESLVLWNKEGQHLPNRGKVRPILMPQGERKPSIQTPSVMVSISREAARMSSALQAQDVKSEKPASTDDLKLNILKLMIEKLTGKKIKIASLDEIVGPQEADSQVEGFGLIYELQESHYERQEMRFWAKGTISTSDGREMEFEVDLTMTREFYTEHHLELRAGQALKDPLSINFSGTAAQLTNSKFSFDIDLDGTSEQISFLRPGSGLLALDRNGDGKINDGSELFGARTGDGFAELGQFDADGNKFIDGNDPVFKHLLVWERGEDGTDRLLALGKLGIGAIFLGNATSSFDLRDQANNLEGQIRSTGLFIGEDGSVGTVQQLDLVV